MLEALCFLFFVLLLPLVIGQPLQLFDHTNNPFVFGYIISDALPDNRFFFALGTDEYFAIAFDHQLEYNALLAECVSALRDYSRDAVVEVVLLVASFAVWSDVFGR